MNSLERATGELKKGNMVIVFDGDDREGEADLMFHASFTTPEKIMKLRKEAGGLICLATDKETADKLELPFFADFVCAENSPVKEMKCTKTAYGDKPAFSISINHKKVFTGITDNDRALTVSSFEKINSKENFVNEFYTPGHVFLLISSGIENRKGHTELSIELAKKAGLSPSMVLCEMLDFGKALSKDDARKYAEDNGFVFLEGKEIW